MGERWPDTLVVAEGNRDAARRRTDRRAGPNGALALVGPRGAGKTHLALAWALETGARQVSPAAAPDDAAAIFREAEGRLFVDDADTGDESMLWRVRGVARSAGGAGRVASPRMRGGGPVQIPDLRSRLGALAMARLGEPDEALMEVVLRRICREQFIQLSDDAARYLAHRLPRTFAAARHLAAALDAELVRGARPVALAAAKRALEKARANWGAAEDG